MWLDQEELLEDYGQPQVVVLDAFPRTLGLVLEIGAGHLGHTLDVGGSLELSLDSIPIYVFVDMFIFEHVRSIQEEFLKGEVKFQTFSGFIILGNLSSRLQPLDNFVMTENKGKLVEWQA